MWLHGVDVLPCEPIEASVSPDVPVHRRSGLRIRRVAIPDADVVELKGMRATSLIRSLADAGGALALVDAVVLLDAALHTRRVRMDQLIDRAQMLRRRRGADKFRRALALADPNAESPMETRLRALLVLGGLPRPRVQVSIHDADGRFAGRVDLFYEAARLAIEYDGAVHRGSLAADDRRQNRLLDAGVRLLRFTAGDVLGDPESVVSEVRGALLRGSLRSGTWLRKRAG
jgi:very-short-patch-repair endonuclease